jgi:hypothetical protein
VITAWFAASHWSGSEPERYRVPAVAQIENPSVPVDVRPGSLDKPDIRIAAFLPQVPARPPAAASTLILYSVMTGNDVHLATINGHVVKEGDRVDGYLVKHITANGVELAKGGKTRRLPMRPLHELPPPVLHSGTDLAQNLSATVDSSQP